MSNLKQAAAAVLTITAEALAGNAGIPQWRREELTVPESQTSWIHRKPPGINQRYGAGGSDNFWAGPATPPKE